MDRSRCGQVQAADLLNQAHLMSLSVPKWMGNWWVIHEAQPRGGPCPTGTSPVFQWPCFFFWFRVHAKLPTSDISVNTLHITTYSTYHICICVYMYKYIYYIILYYIILYYIISYYITYIILYYIMLCYVMLCYIILLYYILYCGTCMHAWIDK